mgnify:CR=1 FL=1
MSQLSRPRSHLLAPEIVSQQPAQYLEQLLFTQLSLYHQLRRSGCHKSVCILALMIVGGVWKRHQNCRPACCCQFGHRARAAAAQDQVGSFKLCRHVIEIRRHRGEIAVLGGDLGQLEFRALCRPIRSRHGWRDADQKTGDK